MEFALDLANIKGEIYLGIQENKEVCSLYQRKTANDLIINVFFDVFQPLPNLFNLFTPCVCVYIHNERRLFSTTGIKELILVTFSVRLAVGTEDIIQRITVCFTKS